jgi:hypothetical protein
MSRQTKPIGETEPEPEPESVDWRALGEALLVGLGDDAPEPEPEPELPSRPRKRRGENSAELYLRATKEVLGRQPSQAEVPPSNGRPEAVGTVEAVVRGQIDPLQNTAPKPVGEGDAPELRAPPGTVEDKPTPPFIDLGPYMAGEVEQEVPTVGELWRDVCLFYAGRLNAIHGEPGVGKSNVLYATALDVLAKGGEVLWIDPEDTPQGTANRLRSLGGDPEEIRQRFHYLQEPSIEDIKAAQLWAADRPLLALVVLDGLAESMAGAGRDERQEKDVLAHFKEVLRPFQREGVAVVLADHVTKSVEGRGRWGRGSGAKLGRYDGASYSVEEGKPYGPWVDEGRPGTEGHLRLRVAKDRNGGVGVPAAVVVAELHLGPVGEGRMWMEWKRPCAGTSGPWEPTTLMQRVVDHLTSNGTATKTDLRRLGNSEYLDKAVEILRRIGAVVVERHGAANNHSLTPDGGQILKAHLEARATN